MEKELIGTGHAWEKDFPFTAGGPAPWTQICKIRDGALVFIAGQVAYDDLGRIIASDNMKAQAKLAYSNVKDALESAGAKVNDIVCERIYVPDMEAYMKRGHSVRAKFYADAGVVTLPPMTLIGVNRLAHKDLMIEIEVIAATG
jgi:2-iminobutanoate/2-iminopropanoate deaminase